ncbi:hypothetical protein PSENEW3n2_00000878 [Picochlorum sp. SENEW3]|nr:hypothetical protein PSENEW3n2_00000878 [Picochlorum sp. SENEW3]WPT15800.1 hypothetical protein PSENEW3_00000878 [Picochlorum sp. SENEW3]
MLRSQDYVLFPEGSGMDENNKKTLASSGATPLVIYLGQHTKDLSNVKGTKLFKPLCLTKYFASLYFCSWHSCMDTPMNPKFIEEALSRRPFAKEKLILYDPDPNDRLDISKIQLPDGYKLEALQGLGFDGVVKLFSRAKVYFDSFLTGRERGLFESSLFDVIPIAAHHAGANIYTDYPMMTKWLWNIFNYTHLNDLIKAAVFNYEHSLRDFEPLRTHVDQMDARFTKSVEEYFSDDFAIVLCTFAPSSAQVLGTYSANAVLNMIISKDLFPFTSVELVSLDSFSLEFEFADIFRDLRESHHAYDVFVSEMESHSLRQGDMSIFFHKLARRSDRYLYILDDTKILDRGEVKQIMAALTEDYDLLLTEGMFAARAEVVEYMQSKYANASFNCPKDLMESLEIPFRSLDLRGVGREQVSPCHSFEKALSGNYLRRYMPTLEKHYYVRKCLERIQASGCKLRIG